ncbi:hypothetical protein BAE44_0002309 [Dichanthelium oligosanthes]|uniref:Uncharacterized protein n=1 Tax=Dichanthelium oligosanthes TaxID=888268 RepID=A0A1E5WH12_9POAL|nr:hypothetical protein BAE44_0002309 [Dichanthelium oligosanthes]
MKRSFRRFVNLVADNCARNAYTLRLIDMSSFFLPVPAATTTTSVGDPPLLEDRRLPEPCISFYSPLRDDDQSDDMDFMLLGDKVVATDGTGGAFMAPSGPGRARAFQALVSAYSSSSSPATGGHWSQGRTGRLQWRALPPPPPHDPFCAGAEPTWIDSCAALAVGSRIWTGCPVHHQGHRRRR